MTHLSKKHRKFEFLYIISKYAKILFRSFSRCLSKLRGAAGYSSRCTQSLIYTRSVFRRRDNHISQAITCLCISIIPWRRSPRILARIPRIFYALCSAALARVCTLRTLSQIRELRPAAVTAGCRRRERRRERQWGLGAQRTTLISLIELSTRDCCNYDYL